MALRLPPPRDTVRPLPLMSPRLKLIVDVAGAAVGIGPRKTAQPFVPLTTVTLPVTAVALPGMPPRPLTLNVSGVLAGSLLPRPLADRVSSRRAGVTGTYTTPLESAV